MKAFVSWSLLVLMVLSILIPVWHGFRLGRLAWNDRPCDCGSRDVDYVQIDRTLPSHAAKYRGTCHTCGRVFEIFDISVQSPLTLIRDILDAEDPVFDD